MQKSDSRLRPITVSCPGNSKTISEFQQLSLLRQLKLDENSISRNTKRLERVKETIRFVQQLDQNSFSAIHPIFTSEMLHFLSSEKNKPILEHLRAKLAGKTVIDPGCGFADNVNYALALMAKLGVSKYIGVDMNLLAQMDLNINGLERGEKLPKMAFIQEDMLVFISGLLDKSANFFVCGLDACVIKSAPYWERLHNEITRAAEKAGMLFGLSLDLAVLPGKNFKKIFLEECGTAAFAFEKIA